MSAPTITDAELIAQLRRRLARQEAAVLAFLEVLQTTGSERQAAWDAWQAAPPSGMAEALARTLRLQEFLAVYERTMPQRRAASEALHRALTMTWDEAVLSAHGMSEAARAYWLTETEAVESEGSLAVATLPSPERGSLPSHTPAATAGARIATVAAGDGHPISEVAT